MTKELPLHLSIAKPAWGILLWVKGEATIVEAHVSHIGAIAEAKKYGQTRDQNVEVVRIQWWVNDRKQVRA